MILLFNDVKIRFLDFNLNKNKTKTDASNPNTPPSLFGMARKMAYANKKYHSGWIWLGVTRILAGIKFSASMKVYPNIHENRIKDNNITKK